MPDPRGFAASLLMASLGKAQIGSLSSREGAMLRVLIEMVINTNIKTETVTPRWSGIAIVAATGPSLTKEVAEQCRGQNCIAVSDAYKLLPFAQVLYSCDVAWWKYHAGCPHFAGEKWSSHGFNSNDKSQISTKYGLKLIHGEHFKGFSFKPDRLHYGSNSGFQAVNLALLFGATTVVLVGFDMRFVNGKQHFFGSHPPPLNRSTAFQRFIDQFKVAAKNLPKGVEVINCTPGSAMTVFPIRDLKEVLDGVKAGN
jgi:hypothetical protein